MLAAFAPHPGALCKGLVQPAPAEVEVVQENERPAIHCRSALVAQERRQKYLLAVSEVEAFGFDASEDHRACLRMVALIFPAHEAPGGARSTKHLRETRCCKLYRYPLHVREINRYGGQDRHARMDIGRKKVEARARTLSGVRKVTVDLDHRKTCCRQISSLVRSVSWH